ncbi:MAG: methyltransferase domain-containing protein [Phycisphaerales bacterium]|nr:methyltransferase domain-containing protein [Phycisphaerales bacterium]
MSAPHSSASSQSTAASPASPPEYVLGTGSDELARLAFQHRLWSDAAHAAWKLAGILPGHTILDAGCGPGFATFDLAQLVGRAGHVFAVDESAAFIDHVASQSRTRDLPNITALVGDVQNLAATLTPAMRAHAGRGGGGGVGADLAYARWVLCFLKRPDLAIAGIAAALTPGGRLCIHDYFDYESMSPGPRRDSYTQIVAATAKSWRDRGGDPDVMARVPALLRDAGLEITHLALHHRVARPHETMFHWADTWWRNYVPKLVQMGYVTEPQQAQFFKDLDELAASPTSFLVLPPVFEIVAVKK